MATKLVHETICSKEDSHKCPCGWLEEVPRTLPRSLVDPLRSHSSQCKGVAWTARAVSGLWDRGEAVIKVEDRPKRRDRGQGYTTRFWTSKLLNLNQFTNENPRRNSGVFYYGDAQVGLRSLNDES